jgi:hypothetical protein
MEGYDIDKIINTIITPEKLNAMKVEFEEKEDNSLKIVDEPFLIDNNKYSTNESNKTITHCTDQYVETQRNEPLKFSTILIA